MRHVPGWAQTTSFSVNRRNALTDCAKVGRRVSSSLPQKASILTELGGATCYAERRFHFGASDNLRDGVHSACLFPSGSREVPRAEGLLSGARRQDSAARRSPELEPRGPRKKLMASGLLCLPPTICASGHRFSRWPACGCSWKEISLL